MLRRTWVVVLYDWCCVCQIRVVNGPNGVLCAMCSGEAHIELEKLLKEG